jgi:hypothetical protein
MTLRAPGRFLICALGLLFFSSAALSAVCDPQLDKKLCVSEHANSRVCKSLPESYKQYRIEEQLLELFQNSPEMVQLGFCNVEKIALLKDWHRKAVDAYVLDNHMYFSRSKMFELSNPDLDDPHLWGKYKWPIHHRGQTYYFTDFDELEKRVQNSNKNELQLSYHFTYIFLHELAHVIDLEPNFHLGASGGFFSCFVAHQVLNQAEYESRQSAIKGYDWLFSTQFKDGLDSGLHHELMAAPYGSF